MKKAKIGVVTLGHYIYFEQFEGLKEELTKKSAEFCGYIEKDKCEIFDAGYVDKVEESFDAVRKLKSEDLDLLFIILSTNP